MSTKRASKRKRGRQLRFSELVRTQQPMISVKYELEATTSLVPYGSDRETLDSFEAALKRRRELKRTHYYVSLTEVTETRKTMRAAAES